VVSSRDGVYVCPRLPLSTLTSLLSPLLPLSTLASLLVDSHAFGHRVVRDDWYAYPIPMYTYAFGHRVVCDDLYPYNPIIRLKYFCTFFNEKLF